MGAILPTRQVLSISLALVAANLVVYAPVRHHDFLNFDDSQYVSENANVAAGVTWRGVAWAFTSTHAGNWHPLTWLSHMLDVQLHGMAPGPHHVTNLLLHTANTLLLFALLWRMTGALWRSAFVAGLFAVHPLHVESVAWLAERKDVLSTLFGLLALHAYLAYVGKPRPGLFAWVTLLFALSLLSKPMLVTLPLLMLLLDVWPLRRLGPADGSASWTETAVRHPTRPLAALVAEKLPLLALSLASSVVTYLAQQQAGAVKALNALPLQRRAANAALAYATYVGQTLWPARLAPIYPYPRELPGWLVLAAVLGITAVTVLLAREARRKPYLLVGWLWYVVALVPVIGLVQVGGQPRADRYTYLPLVGLWLVIAWGIPDLFRRLPWSRFALAAAAGLALCGGALAARAQVGHWRDSIALWEHALAVTTDNYRAHANLAHALTERGRLGEAVTQYEEALRLKPDFAETHNNFGVVLADQGRAEEAIERYSEALRLVPDYEEAHNNLGIALAGQGKLEAAIHHFTEALEIRPGRAVTHKHLGLALAAHGSLEAAIAHYTEALRLEPDDHATRSALGTALADQGKVDDAIQQFLEALRLRPGDADLQYDVAVMFARKGDLAEARRHFEAALSIDSGHLPARQALEAVQGRDEP